jgi:predicted nucleic acid-binding protein
LKLWLLDADVIIKFLEIDVFDKLVSLHKIHVSSSVIDEVRFYRRSGKKIPVNFREQYIDTGLIIELTASVAEIQHVLQCLPKLKRESIHAGETESIAILVRDESLKMCTFDAAALRILPFLNVSDRAVSAEHLLNLSGLTLSSGNKLDAILSENYFRSKLDEGKKDFIYSFSGKK